MTGDQRRSRDSRNPVVPPEISAAPEISVEVSGVGDISTAGGEPLEEHHRLFAEFQEGYMRDLIALADTKAAWAFAVASGVLAFLLGHDAVRQVLLAPSWTAKFALGATGCIFLALAAACAFLVIAPRLKSTAAGTGVVFFGDVAKRPNALKYVSDVAKLGVRDIAEAQLRHTYDLSRICQEKYSYLRKAIWLGLPGLLDALLINLWL